jgi:hypothetical protein
MVDFLNLCERYVGSASNRAAMDAAVQNLAGDAIRIMEANFERWMARIKTDNAARVREVMLNGYRQEAAR